jgi:hypothetical protein
MRLLMQIDYNTQVLITLKIVFQINLIVILLLIILILEYFNTYTYILYISIFNSTNRNIIATQSYTYKYVLHVHPFRRRSRHQVLYSISAWYATFHIIWQLAIMCLLMELTHWNFLNDSQNLNLYTFRIGIAIQFVV